MSGHSVSQETAAKVVKDGTMWDDYGTVRCYLYNGDYYFVPEKLCKAVEAQNASPPRC
jgi:hypothetical protein